MPLVKVTFVEEDFEVEADTIQELKEKISTELSKDQEENNIEVGEKWRLFQCGFLLPNAPATKLEDFKDCNGEIQLNLVQPKRLPRGQPREFENQTDTARFIVVGGRSNFRTLQIEPMRRIPVRGPRFSANDKFGVATNNYRDDMQRVQFDVYRVDQTGHVVLTTSPDGDEVWLVPENSADPSSDKIRLHRIYTNTYDRRHIIRPRDWINIGISGVLGAIGLGFDIEGLVGNEAEN